MDLECEYASIFGKKNELVWSSRNGDMQIFLTLRTFGTPYIQNILSTIVKYLETNLILSRDTTRKSLIEKKIN